MHAVRIHQYGGPEVLTLEEVASPDVLPNDVLVRVHATSVNPVDWKIRSGSQRGAIRLRLPWILGMDVSGVVEAVGARVTGFAVGDQVWSSPTYKRPGTYAEMVAIDAAEVAHKPAGLSHCEAASLPLVGLTAWDCLVRAANVQSGHKVLIHAGAGGVGTVAIQLAKHLGAEVATTCSAHNVEFVKSLGADHVIDYNQTRFEDVLKGYDVVLESLGGEIHQRSLQVLRRGGHLTSINSGLPAATAKYGPTLGVAVVGFRLLVNKMSSRLGSGIKTSMVVRKASGANLAAFGALVEAGDIRPEIAEVFELERIADAHRASESGHTRGKNVIELR